MEDITHERNATESESSRRYEHHSATQSSTTHPTRIAMNNPYYGRTQHAIGDSQQIQYQDRNTIQRPPMIALQRPKKRLSHISSLSKQEVDHRTGPRLQTNAVADLSNNEYNTAIQEDQRTNFRLQNSQAYSDFDGNIQPVVLKSRKNDPDRLKNMIQRSSGNLSAASQAPTMEALTAAIRNGLQSSGSVQRPEPVRTRTDPGIRLPFQEDPDSPSSMYTDLTASQARPQSETLSMYQGYDPRDSRPSTIHEHEAEAEDFDRSGLDTGLPTPNSISPIFSNEHPGMSSKIPASKRPPKLDIDAVRDMESRGSMTSLPDLIRRATRLATNLDKGKTASRLGLLDFFGSNERAGSHDRRDSSFSEVLESFPKAGTPNPDRPMTLWPDDQKQVASKEAPAVQEKPVEKRPRRVCGMPLMWFLIMLTAVVLLVAAAVLIPVFLIVLPRAHAQTDPNTCPTSHRCSNGGVSVIVNNVCSCICVDGFTGSDCSAARDPGCATYNLSTSFKAFNNATIGASVLSVLNSSETVFNINLNQTNLLAIFANNNLSCTSENSLVEFAGRTAMKSKRYVMLPGMMSTEQHVPALNLPPSESKEHKRYVIVDDTENESRALYLPKKMLHRRENTVSANGIVFATSTNVAGQATSSQPVATATATSSASATATSAVDTKQLDFAGTVVLYVLQAFEQINVAVAANQAIASYFKATGHKNNTVEVVSGSQRIDANFDKLQIVLANGTVLGGS